MKTIAQQINWDFEANGNLVIRDKNNELIYWEDSNRVWEKSEYDSQRRLIYRENSTGFWAKYEYDSKGNRIYFETSNGIIEDNRPKSCEGKIVEIGGEKFKLVKV